MFILQNAPKQYDQIPGLNVNWIPLYTGTAKYDLNVWVRIEPELEIIFEYRADLFRAATIKSMLSDYQSVLQHVANNPGSRIHDLLTPGKSNTVSSAAVSRMTGPKGKTKCRVASSDDVQSSLMEIWQIVFGIRPIGIDDDFFQLGGDSLLAARLFAQVEETFEVNLPLATLLEAPTIRQMAGLITSPKTTLSGSSLVIIQPTGTKPPLFFVHPHSGIISHPRKFARSLGPDQPLYGLTAQAVQGEQPYKHVEEMAAHCVQEIRTIQPKGPYYLSGLCFGGMVAYEMARLLKAKGEEIALLALLNTPSPGSLKGWTYLVTRMMYELRKLHALPLKEKLDVFSRKTARWLRGSFERAFWRVLPYSSKLLAANKTARRSLSIENLSVLAAKAYNPGSYVGRITLFLTGEVGSRYAVDPEHGWAELAQGGIELYRIGGDNFTLFNEKNIQSLGEQFQFCLERARREHASSPTHASASNAA